MAKISPDGSVAPTTRSPQAPEDDAKEIVGETPTPSSGADGVAPTEDHDDIADPAHGRAIATVSSAAVEAGREDQARSLRPRVPGFSIRRAPPSPASLETRPVVTLGPDGVPTDVPKVLFETDQAKVIIGDTESAGDFYCEHLLFVALREAHREGSSVVANRFGEPLVGFLHVPSDRFCSGLDRDYGQAERHAGARQVIGAALWGYTQEAMGRVDDGPVKILITGYEAFGTIRNNPTGELVREAENVDAAMRHAFGADLLTPTGRTVNRGDGTPGSRTLAYEVRVADGTTREIQIRTESLPVSDTALNPGEIDSLPGAMASFGPHAVISMGVAPSRDHRAEYHADDGDLGLLRDGTVRHGVNTGNAADPEQLFEVRGEVSLNRPRFRRRLLDTLKEIFTLGFIVTETHNPGQVHRDELRARGIEIGRRILEQRADAALVREEEVMALVLEQNPWLRRRRAREVTQILLEGIQSQGLQPQPEGQRVQPHNFSLARAIHAGRPQASPPRGETE